MFEIKSERGVLKRVENHYFAFPSRPSWSHKKWFEERATPNATAIRFLKPNEHLDFLRHSDSLCATRARS